MMNNCKYEYALWDLSYVIQRNMFGVSKDKKAGEYTAGDLIKSCIYTFNKVQRDFGITAEKHVLLLDRWDGDKGYVTTQILGGAYKDGRGDIDANKGKSNPIDTYMTKEKFEKMKSDPDVSQKDLDEAYEKLYKNEVRFDAKWGMVKELKNFGFPSLGIPGWEFDNLAYLASAMLYQENRKHSVIITQDSDLTYALSPTMEFFRIPKSGQDPITITYEEMYDKIPDSLKSRMSLYNYKSYMDSLGMGHNQMRRTKKEYVDPVKTIEQILEGDYSNVDDIDLFKLQLSTFDLGIYPRLEEAKRSIIDLLPTCGRLGSLQEWHNFCDKFKIVGLSDGFFTTFISRFNPALYCER